MKNLRRVLSLALSGVMLVGMMAMSASAVNAEDFTDSDEITHKEAVSISTALKIIDGKEDGSFDPDGYVTRGQMAKMITRAMFGGEDPVLGLPGTPSFTDIKGRWDESYIEYCSNNGIINGRGDGTFDPEGNVTGTEAAKMLLSALGYKADIYGLVGPDWAITTNSIANQTKVALYADLKGLDPTKPFTRDQVAQMVYNALNANTREMNPTMEITGKGDITYQYTDSGRTLLYDKYGAVRVEAVVDDNEFSDNSDIMKGKTAVTIKNDAELAAMLIGPAATTLGLGYTSPSLKVSSGKDVFGKAVIVYVKPSSSNPKDLSKGTAISEVIIDENTNNVATTTKAPSSKQGDLTGWAKDQGLKFNTTTPAAYYTNYAPVTKKADGSTALASGDFGYDNSGAPDYVNKKGVEITIIDNDGDGYVDVVLQNVYTFGQVTKYSTKDKGSVTVRSKGVASAVKTNANAKTALWPSLTPTNAELSEIVAYDDIAADDYVNVTLVSDTYYIEKAEVVDGTLIDYVNKPEDGGSSSSKLTVDDASYDKSDAATLNPDNLKSFAQIANSNVLKEHVTIYLDAFGYVAAGDTDVASDFLYVANAAWNTAATSLGSGTLTAYVYLEDGTSGSYVVDKITYNDGTAVKASQFDGTTSKKGEPDELKGRVFKYTINSNNRLVLEAALATATAGKQQEIVNDGATAANVAGNNTNWTIYKRGESTLKYNASANTGTGASIKYITDDTVVFYVTLDRTAPGALTSAGTIDKVSVYTGKTAPSMSYQNESGNALYGSGFYGGNMLVTNADDNTKLDAVVFANVEAVGSQWIYLIDYVKTVDEGRVYNAIVDGEVKQITTNDKAAYAVPNAYEYFMDGDLYDLNSNLYAMANVGTVTNVDNKSVVITKADGTKLEGMFTGNTITALLDSDKTELDTSISEGDVVALIVNDMSNRQAEAVFVITEADASSTGVAYMAPGVSKTGAAISIKANEAGLGATDALSVVKGLVTFGGNSTAKWYKTATAASWTEGTTAAKTIYDTAEDGEALTASAGTYKVVVFSNETVKAVTATTPDTTIATGYTIYTVTVTAS